MVKGQMKIQQMAFMLIAVILFFALVGLFFLSFVFSDLKKSAEVLNEQNTLLLVSKLAESPEFSCGNSFGTSKTNCIDSDKVMALKNNVKYTESNFWGISGLEIKKIYPVMPSIKNKECTVSNYPNCDKITIIKGKGVGISNFVSLCRKQSFDLRVQNKCELARLIIYY